MRDSGLDDVFDLLKHAERLAEQQNPIESATKYYEAVYLMRRIHDRMPSDSSKSSSVKLLLQQKSNHYEQVAQQLMREQQQHEQQIADNDNVSADLSSLTHSPRSPITVGDRSTRFFSESYHQPSHRITGRRWSATLEAANNRAHNSLSTALDYDEQGDQKQTAIAHYMEAAERYLKVLEMAKTERNTNALQTLVKKRLQSTIHRLEELKGAKKGTSTATAAKQGPRATTPPPPNNPLSKDEIDILKQSSLIASGLFLPWSNADAEQLARDCRKRPVSFYTDPDGFLKLSPKQQERFHCWARPSEIVRLRQQNSVLGSVLGSKQLGTPVVIQTITPYTIQQKYVTDCSFIASLCICATFERRFRKRLVTSIMHPQVNGQPVYNPHGKYMVKLWLNGVARCVTIDDYLPIDKHGNLLCSGTTRTSTLELWVCLVEKAYMKLCGGYDFPGSNSGVDLFSLTGWIPERVHFSKTADSVKDYETPPERAWERVHSAHSYGDCLITVSTQHDLPDEEANRVGLVKGHAYAVLGVKETSNGTRLLQLKNPWAHQSWKGTFSSGDAQSWRSPAFRREVGYDPEKASKVDDGVFFIGWDDILRYFKNFHMSWNPDPELFRHQLSVHGRWLKSQGPDDDTFNVGDNPQYTLQLSDAAIQKKATLWIQISRHVDKQELEGKEASDYLTVHIHRNTEQRERIFYPGTSGNCVLTGCYTNNPHVLVRYDVQGKEDKNLSLVLSQYQKASDLNYTLSCYCTELFQLGSPEHDLKNEITLEGTWSTHTSGGPVGSPSFNQNPQYAVRVPAATSVRLLVSASKTNASNVILIPVRSFGDSIDKAIDKPVIDSGKYRHGFVASEKSVVPAGTYALIVSNFHAGQTGLFEVKIKSGSPRLVVKKITDR